MVALRVHGNGSGSNENGEEAFQGPKSIISLHLFRFCCGVRSLQRKETEPGESVSAPSGSFTITCSGHTATFPPWRGLVTVGGGNMKGHSFSCQSSVKGGS